MLRLAEDGGRFDPLTGEVHYAPRRGSLLTQVRSLVEGVPAPVKWLACAGALWVGWEAAQWAMLRARAASLRRRGRACNDVEDLAALVYSVAPSHLGGFLTNARVQAVVRGGGAAGTDPESDARVLLFASGGWRYTPHSLSALPLVAPYPSSDDARTLWWLAVTLGKSMVLNGSMAFLISSRLMEAERDERATLYYRGRKVVDVGFCSGTLYSSIAPLQRSSASPSPSVPASVTCRPIDRLELVCEIGTLSAARVAEYQQSHWGMSPDPRSEALGEVADFGTARVWQHWHATRSLPSHDAPGFGEVLWEKRTVTPPQGRDCWMWIDVEGLTDELAERERIHVDMGVYFARGISAGNQGDREAETRKRQQQEGGAPSAAASAWHSVCGALSTLRLRLSALLPASLAPTGSLSSSSPLSPFSGLPRPLLLPDSLVHGSGRGGLGARVTEEARGWRDVIGMLHRRVLINSDEPNTTHAQMRSLLLDTLALCGMRNRFVAQRLPPPKAPKTASAGSSGRRAGRADAAGAPGGAPVWDSTPHVERKAPKARQSRSERERAKRRAKQREQQPHELEAEEDEEDEEDEEAIDIDTDSVRSEVDQVD